MFPKDANNLLWRVQACTLNCEHVVQAEKTAGNWYCITVF